MFDFIPANYKKINSISSRYTPTNVKAYNNKAYQFWARALYERMISIVEFKNLPTDWTNTTIDFFYFCLFAFGYVAFFEDRKTGIAFQPCALKGYNFYYQPREVIVTNPIFKKTFTLGKGCELLKLTPNYMGTFDIISYYAEKLASLDVSINTSIINSKFAYILGAKNKTAGQALRKMLDKINQGEPAVIYDTQIFDDKLTKESPFQFLERTGVKNGYITTDLLSDFMTILNNFDKEIGIPTTPYQKKERMTAYESQSQIVDSTARAITWKRSLNNSLEIINSSFGLNIQSEFMFDKQYEDEVNTEAESEVNDNE